MNWCFVKKQRWETEKGHKRNNNEGWGRKQNHLGEQSQLAGFYTQILPFGVIFQHQQHVVLVFSMVYCILHEV